MLMLKQWVPLVLVFVCPAVARAQETQAPPPVEVEEHHRLSVTFEALHLLVPVFQLKTELALHRRWGVSVLGGYGRASASLANITTTSDVFVVGAQGAYYFSGRFDRGFEVGLDFHLMRVEQPEGGTAEVFSLGNGSAVGPFVGYKRAFGPGLTLEAQLGVQVTMGQASDPVIPHVAVSAGWSFLRPGKAPVEVSPASGAAPTATANPLDQHKGFLIGISIGGGVIDCDNCDIRPGLAVDGELGYFLGRRFALMYDMAASLGISESAFASVGVVLQSLALQYWPHPNLWLKGGVGVGRLLVASPLVGEVDETGGGMTLAIGYEFHYGAHLAMDVHLRSTLASFDRVGGKLEMTSYSGLLGFTWY